MNAARQVLRFSIPGAVLVLWVLACFGIYKRCQGVDIFQSAALVRESVSSVLIVVMTVPVGFLVYQVYKFTYGPIFNVWPARWSGRLVRVDRGAGVLHGFSRARLDDLCAVFGVELDVGMAHRLVPDPGSWREFAKGDSWYRYPQEKLLHWLRFSELTEDWKGAYAEHEVRVAYTRRWHHNWDTLRVLVDIAGSLPESAHIKHEHTIFSDLYDSLGATRTAITLGWAVTLAISLTHVGRIAHEPIGSLGGIFLITVFTFAVATILHVARQRTWGSASSSLRLGLRWLFRHEEQRFTPKEAPEQDADAEEAVVVRERRLLRSLRPRGPG